MRKVYKYDIVHGDTSFELPQGYKILAVQEQYGQLVLYADVDIGEESLDIVTIRIIGTGHTIPDVPLEYINTIMESNGLVWHAYREIS